MDKRCQCHSCGNQFEDFKSLAQHIVSSKSGHRKGKKWAHRFLLQQQRLDQKRELRPRTPLTEEQKENRKNLVRELSGETDRVNTLCPKCKRTSTATLESEYVRSGAAWTLNNRFVLMCQSCSQK